MKNLFKFHSFLFLLLAGCGQKDEAAVIRINPNNPEVKTLPEADFSLSATDLRHTALSSPFEKRTRTLNLVFDRQAGNFFLLYPVSGRPLSERPYEPVLKSGQYGDCFTISVSSEDPAFRGVNAASDSPSVDVLPLNGEGTSFRLIPREKGSSWISLWNGDGSNKLQFCVHSDISIQLQEIEIEFRGKKYLMNKYDFDWWYSPASNILSGWAGRLKYTLPDYVRDEEDCVEKGVLFRICPLPLNATDDNFINLRRDYWSNSNTITSLISENLSGNPDFDWFSNEVTTFKPFELLGLNIIIFHGFYLDGTPAGIWNELCIDCNYRGSGKEIKTKYIKRMEGSGKDYNNLLEQAGGRM